MDNKETLIESPVVLLGDPVLPQLLADGLAHHQENRLIEAEQVYNSFLQQNPEHPQVLAFLGTLAAQKGKANLAISLLEKAIQVGPNLADPKYCLSLVLHAQGRSVEAVTPCTYAMAQGHPKAKQRLELLLNGLGAAEQAISSKILVQFCMTTNQKSAALEHAQVAINATPNDLYCWIMFSRCIAHTRFNSTVSPTLIANITKAFTIDNIDYRLLTNPALTALLHEKLISPLILSDKTSHDRVTLLRKYLRLGTLDVLLKNELLMRLLRSAIVTDTRFETFLTSLREAVLWNILDEQQGSLEKQTSYLYLISYLASQLFLNEYVWTISAEESAAVEIIIKTVCDKAELKESVPPELLGILGAYSPLFLLPCAKKLQSMSWPVEITEVIETQITEPLEEQRLRRDIPTISPPTGRVTRLVRSQYEENPFPRWKILPIGGRQSLLEDVIASKFPFLKAEECCQSRHPQILVAGCGTGFIPNDLARHIKNASITGLDLSLASLSYAKRKSNELGFTSIEYLHGDILDVSKLERQFDHINCYGVLHHMEEPLAGWRSLNDCLRPGGTMQIGLYSEINRKSITRVRQHISELGYKPSIKDMRRCREDVAGRQDEPLFRGVLNSMSFYSMSEFRDLVFHSKEHQLTLPKINDMLTDLELEFIGFQHEHPLAVKQYCARFPQDPEMRSFENWNHYEIDNPATFRNCYNFWVRKPA